MKVLICENDLYRKTEIPDGQYLAYSHDENMECTCPGCGKTFRFGDMFTSQKYLTTDMLLGLFVCEECYEKEHKTKKEFLIEISYTLNRDEFPEHYGYYEDAESAKAAIDKIKKMAEEG